MRGVYFSSGTQEGSPIDRVMGALAGAFGLDRQALPAGVSNGRSYFITRLLSDVIFKEADLVGTNLHFDKKRKMIMWGSCAALALLFVICSVSLGVSYSRNKQYIADVTKSVDALEKQVKTVPQQVTPLVILPVLDAARSIPGGFAEKNADVPVMSRLGLSQRPKLGEGANSLYSRLLKQSMLPLVQGRIEEQLRRGGSANLDELYESLRVYLMMGDGKHFDAETIAGWISFDWDRSLNGATEQQRSALDLHAAALLDAIKEDAPIQLKADLIEATRADFGLNGARAKNLQPRQARFSCRQAARILSAKCRWHRGATSVCAPVRSTFDAWCPRRIYLGWLSKI